MPSMEFVQGPFSPADTEAIVAIDADAFNFPPDRAMCYLQLAGPHNFRAVRYNGQWAACLASIPCGQYFGGRAVPMAGIAAVAVAPEARGRAVAKFMMRSELERLFAARVPISTLYPATIPLYRGVGYEFAGVQYEHRLPIHAISTQDRSLRVRRDTPADAPALARLYAEMAVATNGNVERTDFFWARVRDFRGTPLQGYVFEGSGGIEGYLFLQKRQPPASGTLLSYNTVFLSDFTAATPTAARCMLSFIAAHYSLCDTVAWFGGSTDALWQFILREAFLQSTLRAHWMLRIVHCQAALEARGYSSHVAGEVHLDIRDNILAGNNQRMVLNLRDGRGIVAPGGRGDVRIDVRGLAAVYAGFYSSTELRMAGYLDGEEDGAALLAAACAGPASWMRDPF